MYLDNDPGVLISACLFGDGAGAAVVSRSPRPQRRRIEWKDSASLIEPAQRKALMFEQRDGMLRNILTREVPALAAEHAHRVLETVLGRAQLNGGDIAAWIMHAGGRDVLLALARRFELDAAAFGYSAAMLREYGNLSSAFVYFVLDAALADDAGGWWCSRLSAPAQLPWRLAGGRMNACSRCRAAVLPRVAKPNARPSRAGRSDGRALAPRPRPRQPVMGASRILATRCGRRWRGACFRPPLRVLEIGCGTATCCSRQSRDSKAGRSRPTLLAACAGRLRDARAFSTPAGWCAPSPPRAPVASARRPGRALTSSSPTSSCTLRG